MTLNTFGLYRQTNILADFAGNASAEKRQRLLAKQYQVVGCVSD
ncbi:hypothetical protein QT971_10040 [Microcoleus sp. herbarium19]